jgi:hypothetical protein
MPMTDGNPSEQKEVKAVIDPMSVAQLVVQLQKQQAPAQKPESRFNQKINAILAKGGVDEENLSTVADLIKNAGEDLKEEIAKGGNLQGAQSTQARYNDAVADALEKYTEGDDQLEAMGEHFQSLVVKKLNADSTVMAKFNRGELDKRAVTAAAKAVVEEFSKNILKRDQPSKGPAIKTGVPGTSTSKTLEKSGTPANVDSNIREQAESITDQHRKESYNKLRALFERNKFSREDAHNKAFEAATKQYSKAGR